MNFSQLQDRVRLELLRRIERGTLSVSLLARQTGLAQAHISNFLHGRRGLSLAALDKVLSAQRLQVSDLLPEQRGAYLDEQMGPVAHVPLVPHGVAISDPNLRPSIVESIIPFPGAMIRGLETRCSPSRKQWERFVAVRISAADASGMEPVLLPDAVVLLDRHYTSFKPYREGETNLYGARVGSQLKIRYAQHQADRVVLRPYRAHAEADVVEVGVGETASDVLVGRVVAILNPT
jgi:transcriptional regulator with XRE-family HTH domain